MSDRFRTLEREHYDAIVVGAGLGGLSAAGLLAKRGLSVLVLDQHYVAGGNATTFRRRQYQFDVGIHYLGDCGPNGIIPRILRAAGVEDIQFREMDPDGFDVLCFPDFRFRIPRGFDVLQKRLLEQFPGEARGIERYLRLLREVYSLLWITGPLSALTTLARARLAAYHAYSTLDEFLDTCTQNPRLRAVLAGQHGTYGLPPSRSSVLIHGVVASHYTQGAYYPVGGGQVIADRLVQTIEQHGGKVLLRASARRILVEKGRVVGVELENKHVGRRTVRAPVVISNADLKQTYQELIGPEHVSPRTLKRVHGFEMSTALGVVYLGLRRDLRAEGIGNANFWVYSDYDHEGTYREAAAGRFHPEPYCYISIATLKDPDNRHLAPPGVTNLQLMTTVPSTPEAWGTTAEALASGAYQKAEQYEKLKDAFAERLIAQAERVIPGIRKDIVYREVATPLTHSRFTRSSGGTSYGLAHIPSQTLFRRPGNSTEIRGLFISGANQRTGHGVGGTLQSGLLVASEIVGRSLLPQVMGSANTVAGVAETTSHLY